MTRTMRARGWEPGHTHASGLGWPHQQARKRALAALKDGDACARCEARGIYHPMYRTLPARMYDLDDFPGRMYGGPQVKRLSYAKCNRRAGQRVTMRIRAVRRQSAYTRW